MTKSRSFSIYLLKQGYAANNALREDHTLQSGFKAQNLPEGATLYVLDSEPRTPWWKSYFEINDPLTQVNKGALIFLPVKDRCFALSFGHVAHNLRETSYEYDFGLRVTLNSLDPKKLKSTDVLDPGAAKRQRIQIPIESDLTFFDFDRDSTILRSLTGKVKDELGDLFKQATGASNLRISSSVAAHELIDLCKKLLPIYEDEKYKESFPDIQNIAPVRDPSDIQMLNDILVESFKNKNTDINLTVPEIVNYNDNLQVTFTGAGRGLIYDDVYIGKYYEYLEQGRVKIEDVDIATLRNHSLVLTNEAGDAREQYSIFKSLVFDITTPGKDGETFHLCEGHWYKIDKDYVVRLAKSLDPNFVNCDLPPYKHETEGKYNEAVAINNPAFACLDRKNISPKGLEQIEPCDLIIEQGGDTLLYHVKISTLSANLSHLFNQGLNSIELLLLESDAVDNLEKLIHEYLKGGNPASMTQAVKNRRCQVIFAIITKKNPALKSKNLPLFSRISLSRALKTLQLMNVPAKIMFVEDQTVPSEGKKKTSKKAKAGGDAPEELPEAA